MASIVSNIITENKLELELIVEIYLAQGLVLRYALFSTLLSLATHTAKDALEK
jgi:hypothetical protein